MQLRAELVRDAFAAVRAVKGKGDKILSQEVMRDPIGAIDEPNKFVTKKYQGGGSHHWYSKTIKHVLKRFKGIIMNYNYDHEENTLIKALNETATWIENVLDALFEHLPSGKNKTAFPYGVARAIGDPNYWILKPNLIKQMIDNKMIRRIDNSNGILDNQRFINALHRVIQNYLFGIALYTKNISAYVGDLASMFNAFTRGGYVQVQCRRRENYYCGRATYPDTRPGQNTRIWIYNTIENIYQSNEPDMAYIRSYLGIKGNLFF